MKKFIVITTLVLAAAIVSTVCFAVALGSTTIRDAINGDWGTQIENIKDKVDNIEALFDREFIDDDSYIVSTEALDECEFANETLTIGCDTAALIVAPSTNDFLSAKMDIYSKNQDGYQDIYRMLTSKEGYDLYFEQTKSIASTSIKAVVYVPQTVKNIVVKSSVAQLKVMNMTLDNINIYIETGEAEFENVKAISSNIQVESGEIDLNGLSIENELDAKVEAGEISYKIPADKNFAIDYSIEAGGIEIDESVLNSTNNTKQEVLASTKGRIESKTGIENAVKVNLEVETGKIEIESIY